MRKNVLTLLFCVCVLVSFNVNSNAQSTLIHYWNFNTFTSVVTLPAIANLPADYTRVTSSTATLVYQPQPGTSSAFSDYCDPVTPSAGTPDYDTVNAQMGAPSGNAFRARNPSDSMEILLYIPSTHYTNLQLRYGCELSSYTSGDSVNVFAYSVDSGASWFTSGSGLSEWVDSGSLAFRPISVHFNDHGASNNPHLVFRITTKGRNSGTGGNNRYDNISLMGDTTLLPTGIDPVVAEPTYSLFPNPVTSQVEITSNTDGTKIVSISNAVGQKVYEGSAEGIHALINVANLNAGMYFINIKEENMGVVTTMKFIKQ